MICLGEPSTLLNKLEKPLFFRCALIGLNCDTCSPEDLFISPVSERGGVISTGVALPLSVAILCEPDVLKSGKRRSGDVTVCCGACGRVGCGNDLCWVNGCVCPSMISSCGRLNEKLNASAVDGKKSVL